MSLSFVTALKECRHCIGKTNIVIFVVSIMEPTSLLIVLAQYIFRAKGGNISPYTTTHAIADYWGGIQRTASGVNL